MRPDFGRLDSKETMRALAKAAGGDVQLDALLERAPARVSPSIVDAKAVALVDGETKSPRPRDDVPAPRGWWSGEVVDLAGAIMARATPVSTSIRTIGFPAPGRPVVTLRILRRRDPAALRRRHPPSAAGSLTQNT